MLTLKERRKLLKENREMKEFINENREEDFQNEMYNQTPDGKWTLEGKPIDERGMKDLEKTNKKYKDLLDREINFGYLANIDNIKTYINALLTNQELLNTGKYLGDYKVEI